MSKEGGSGGISSGGRSAGGARGGVGVASRGVSGPSRSGGERSFASSFSSRGLASVGKNERSSLGRASKPSLSFNSERPQLAFRGTSFQSERRSTPKTPGKFYTSEFKATTFPSRRAEGIRSTTPRSTGRIEVASIISQPSRTKEVGSRINATPARSIARRESPVRLVSPNPVARPMELRPNTPFSPRPVEAPRVPSISFKDTPKRVEAKPVHIVRKDIPSTPLVTKTRTVETNFFSRPIIRTEPRIQPVIREVQPQPKVVERVSINTEPLSRLAYIQPEHGDTDEEKKKKRQIGAEQLAVVERAYLRAGLVKDPTEARLRVNRYLGIEPAVLATRTKIEEQTVALPQPEMKPAAVVAQPALQPEMQVKPKVSVDARVSAQAQTQQTSIEQAATQTKAAASVKEKLLQKAKKLITERKKKPEEKQHKKYRFKIDEIAQKNRLQQWRDAVRSVFPAFKYEYKAPLNHVAAALKGPDRSTDSELIYQLGKKVDGSNNSEHDWRTPLRTSEALVNAVQARMTGEIEIFTKPAVVMKEDGKDVKRPDVDRVLAGEDIKQDAGISA